MDFNKILEGDALSVLKTLPDDVVNCVMTSPPYWALRDYGIDGQLGLEPTFDEYISKLCDIFDEVRRVLRDDGTCWVNIGDTYSGGGSGQKDTGKSVYEEEDFRKNPVKTELPDKSLCMIPFRFALEMQRRGWILRNVIIWYKPNCMPSSVKDRFTVDFEYVFFFVKSKRYWFEMPYEPHKTIDPRFVKNKGRVEVSKEKARGLIKGGDSIKHQSYHSKFISYGEFGRNKRTVWKICPTSFEEAHFAVYPEELVEIPLRAGCPEFVCKKCGRPRERIMDKKLIVDRYTKDKGKVAEVLKASDKRMVLPRARTGIEGHNEFIFKGWSDCGCGVGFEGGVVLDPFFGAGTTGLVALKQNKRFIGVELNPDYVVMAEDRLRPWLGQRRLGDF